MTETASATVPAARTAPSAFVRPAELAYLWAQFDPAEQEEIERILAKLVAAVDSGVTFRMVIGHKKGGSGKTMTTAFLALLFGLSGLPVLAVDADKENHALLTWAAQAEDWPANVQVKAWRRDDENGAAIIDAKEMERRIVKAQPRYPVILVDTDPVSRDTFAAALRAMRITRPDGSVDGGVLIIPTSADKAEIQQVPSTLKAAEDVEAATGVPIELMFLVTKARVGTKDADNAKREFERVEMPYFETAVRLLVGISRAVDEIPESFSDYLLVAEELIDAVISREGGE